MLTLDTSTRFSYPFGCVGALACKAPRTSLSSTKTNPQPGGEATGFLSPSLRAPRYSILTFAFWSGRQTCLIHDGACNWECWVLPPFWRSVLRLLLSGARHPSLVRVGRRVFTLAVTGGSISRHQFSEFSGILLFFSAPCVHAHTIRQHQHSHRFPHAVRGRPIARLV